MLCGIWLDEMAEIDIILIDFAKAFDAMNEMF